MAKPDELKAAAGALYAGLQLLEGSTANEILEMKLGAVDLVVASVRFTVNGVDYWADVREYG